MTPYEIEKRLYRCPHLRQADLDGFLAAGVPREALWQPDHLARAAVEYHYSTKLFDFVEDHSNGSGARAAFIFMARDDFFGEVIDLVAWTPKDNLLAAWQGAAGLLGAENVFTPRLNTGGVLDVHQTPLEWLRAGRQGVVIVNEYLAGDLLFQVGPLEVDDPAYARRLRAAVARPAPRIVVRRPRIEEAA